MYLVGGELNSLEALLVLFALLLFPVKKSGRYPWGMAISGSPGSVSGFSAPTL